jgi:ATP-dependent Clp protease ATP-binding subunit ClpC
MILFDEIEKANPLVINVLLQLLNEGQISDAMGKTINFRNCIIIMTSNAGMHNVIASKKTLGFDRLMHEPSKDIIHNDIIKGLKEYFQPEFINRIDATCIFNYLSKDEIIKILDLEIKSVLNRIKINVHVKQETKDKIIKNYYSEEYGARSIKRGVEDLVVDQLSQLIINNPNAESLEL